jgi:hypothetical protein
MNLFVTGPEMKEKMRTLVIYGAADDDLLRKIKDCLTTWQLETRDDGGLEHCLCKNGQEIRLDVIANNVIRTANVLPHDSDGDQDAANFALKDLVSALDLAEISNELGASENELS